MGAHNKGIRKVLSQVFVSGQGSSEDSTFINGVHRYLPTLYSTHVWMS